MKPRYLIGVASLVLGFAGATVALADEPRSSVAWNAFVDAAKSISTYTETVDAYEIAGKRTQRRRYQMYFRKPDFIRTEIVGGEGAGSVAVWRGGTTIRAHRGGILKFVVLTVSEHDPRVVDCRGHSLETPFFPWIIAQFEEIGGMQETLGPSFDGVETDAVTVAPPDPSKYANATKITLYLSKTTHLPVARREWDGEKLVDEARYRNQHVNVDIPDATFKL